MPEEFDLFVSYARADNQGGWIKHFVDALVEEHRKFAGGRSLTYFFDRKDIANFSYWETEIFNKGLTRSRLFLAFLSPNYFASEICRKEWKAWIDLEISRHILTAGSAPIYIVEIPGLISKPMLAEHEVARKVAELCGVPAPHERFMLDVSPLVKEFRRRQLNAVQPFYNAGLAALQQADLRKVLEQLAKDLDERAQHVRRADQSANTIPPYNKKFSGRLDELVELRRRLTDDRAGVIAGIHGLGGIGKTELAFTFAHAFAGVYPGGRFYIPCERQTDLKEAVLHLGGVDVIRVKISDEERKLPATHFAAILRCLGERLDQFGHILLVLDNVTDAAVVSAEQTDALTVLGPKLHLLATTRLASGAQANWLMLGELKADEALDLLEKFRSFADEAERAAAHTIIRKLGGFALAIELVAAGLAVKTSATYTSVAAGLGLDDLDMLAEDRDVVLRRHNHESRLQAILGPTLAELAPEARRALEYAAFLPPDMVPLPWLKELLTEDFPALAKIGKWGDPWDELHLRLVRLGHFTPVEQETTRQRLVRVHRLVQELIHRKLPGDECGMRQDRINRLVKSRVEALERTHQWEVARWELEPLDTVAWTWADSSHGNAVWLMNQIGFRWYNLAEWTRAEPLLRRALQIDKDTLGREHPKVAAHINNLARLLHDTNRLAEAEPLLRRALQIHEHNFGPKHPNVATGLNNLARLLHDTNHLAEAELLLRRALQIHEHNFGPKHPNVATGLNNLAGLLLATNRLAEAEPLMRRALQIDEHSFGPEHPIVARDLNNLADLLQATDRLAEVEPLLRRALQIYEHSFGPEHPDVATCLNNLARLLHATNRLAGAEPLMRRALKIDEHSFGPEHPFVAIDLNNLAKLLQATNRLVEAEPLFFRGFAILVRSQLRTGYRHPKMDVVNDNCAEFLAAIGRSKHEIDQWLQEAAEEARRGLRNT